MGDDEIDGIQLENGTLVEVNNGATFPHRHRRGNPRIGVIGTNTTGSVRSVGTGSVSIIGTGTGARWRRFPESGRDRSVAPPRLRFGWNRNRAR